MGIVIRGIRLEALSFGRDDKGKPKVSGNYVLVSTTDKVLATQPFNQYGGIDVSLSPDSIKAMDVLEASIKRDVHAMIGLDVVEGSGS